MACSLCSVRERPRAEREPNDDAVFHLLAATPAMADLLAGVLAEHHVVCERRGTLFALLSTGPARGKANARVVELLRQVFSEPERRAVSVFCGNGEGFPAPRLLDEWWRVFETAWFEKALTEDLFETWFQPIVDTSTHEVFAHECLIRLQRGRRFSGAEIVDAAIARNEVHRFDAYARSLALRSAARQTALAKPRDSVYFVNFMPSAIYNPDLCLQSTLQTLHECGMRPGNFVFEVVESELVSDTVHLRRICDYYRNHGFGFALDDVGTGATSLQLVRDLAPDFVKLDKTLVRNVERPLCAATIRKVVEICDRADVTVIAPGVERAETLENLWLLGVECMQGYLLGHPRPNIVSPGNDLLHLAMALEEDHAVMKARLVAVH